MKRALFVASSVSAVLAGCAPATNALNDNPTIHRALGLGSRFNHLAIGTRGMAPIYPHREIMLANYPVNSLPTPTSTTYSRLQRDGFRDYRLPVGGLVDHAQSFTLRQLHAMASIDQTTRHDCVEGWSVVGRWQGVLLGSLLAFVKPTTRARYVVFHSFDTDQQGTPFYGSIDLHQADHPQTQLALYFNGQPVPADYGGPVRLRIPTQLGYKSTKWVRSIELVQSFKHIGAGNGGYWEDNGYEWYAGI